MPHNSELVKFDILMMGTLETNQLSQEREASALLFLLNPEVVKYVDFQGLPGLRSLCKASRKAIDERPEELDYWRSMCNSYCYYAGLYSQVCCDKLMHMDYKKHFFSQLLTIKDKWKTGDGDASQVQEYKIKVANRFRPGLIPSDKVCVPLHQFLKVKRLQKAQQGGSISQRGEILVGAEDPEEFVDPLLGTLMKDPVRLAPSGRVVDRSVAVQCVVRGGRDPFTSARLTMQMMEPQPELLQRIQEFRRRKQQRDVSLGLEELKPLVDDATAVNTDLLEALMEVERINQTARRAEQAARAADLAHLETASDDVDGTNHAATEGEGPQTDAEDGALDLVAHDGAEPGLGLGVPGGDGLLVQAEHPDFAYLAPMDLEGRYNRISKRVERAGIVDISAQAATVTMHVPGAGVRPFHYSAVHTGEASQQEVYERSAQDAVTAALNGFNACLMCYGQTGAGKTYTFFGPEDRVLQRGRDGAVLDRQAAQAQGVVLRACEELLLARDQLASFGICVSYSAQFVEIYEEQVTDLFTGQPAAIRRETGQVAGAVEAPFTCMEEIVEALRTGHDRKRFAATQMNERSSRSHTALIIHVAQKLNAEQVLSAGQRGVTGRSASLLRCAAEGGDRLIRSQLHLIDLAGSERVKKSRVEGQRLREAVGINSSLLVLGKVIAALVEGKSHVPYYESKLTTLLKAAFGGSSRTTVIVNCRVDGDSGDETLQSMRFGERCAMVSNSMRIAASSFQSALAAVDSALSNVRRQLESLEARGKQQLPAYRALLHSFQALDRKRTQLSGINGTGQTDTTSLAH